ncbi:hypothetical protein B0E53_01319 [Micromonospora sp. MH33]|uniref:FlgT C-terminal domain-containing protein n=1 Tax=Micromonospora sp. MH33 TaxID=1945509 RepID=UPI000D14A046|nr:FlgT C-terminal domain-containing protein [Micromonospora sp. MH33]PSK66679.1 hypothetical protein B0E53_01319 [Micromonospora sp. MH33]
MSEIVGKVARIINEHELAINVGGDKGIAVGDKVALYRTIDVKDPDSGEILGSVDVRKLRLEVVIVEPKFCVAAITERQTGSGSNIFLQSLLPLKRISSTPVKVGSPSEVHVAVGDVAIFEK